MTVRSNFEIWTKEIREGKKLDWHSLRRELKKLVRWIRKGFVAAHHILLIAEAETASLEKMCSEDDIHKLYVKAINMTSRSGLNQTMRTEWCVK
jgi:hypothetical protein